MGASLHSLQVPIASTGRLTLNEFPSEFENVFLTHDQDTIAGEVVQKTDHDSRQRIQKNDPDTFGYPGIGLLRAKFGNCCFQATASLIAGGSCVLTCANILVHYDVLTKEFVWATNLVFELRENRAEGGSSVIRQYKVSKAEVYPQYLTDPTSHSGFDLGLCWIQVSEDDYFIEQLYSRHGDYMPQPLAGEYSTDKVAVVGFPSQCNCEKWGVVTPVPIDKREDWKFKKDEQKEILVYDFIHTSTGQAGSPVMGMSPRDVIGVHVGGNINLKKKWATYLNPTKLKWITDSLGVPLKEDSNRLYF